MLCFSLGTPVSAFMLGLLPSWVHLIYRPFKIPFLSKRIKGSSIPWLRGAERSWVPFQGIADAFSLTGGFVYALKVNF